MGEEAICNLLRRNGCDLMPMKVLICGGRDYNNYEFMRGVLTVYNIEEIISGEARGADTLARTYAEDYSIRYRGFPADWNTFGKSAGVIRNKRMLVEGKPDLVIAFPGGRGTANMIKQAKEANITVLDLSQDAI